MAKIGCVVANHKYAKTDINEEICITCYENEITRLRSYIQRGISLMGRIKGNNEIDQYKIRAERVLSESL